MCLDDTRRKIIPRQFIFDIADNTDIEFSNENLDWIVKNFEDLLQQKFDIKVENIEVKLVK